MGGILLGSIPLLAVELTYKETGEPSNADQLLGISHFMLISVICALFAYIAYRFSVVKVRNDGLEVYRNGRSKIKDWRNVKKITQIPFCTPPIYRLSFNNSEPPVYVCVFSWITISVGFWSWDLTDFRDNVEFRIASSEGPQRD